MEVERSSSEALSLLARLYRERRSGVLSLGPGDAPLQVLLRDGQVVGVGTAPPPQPDSRRDRPRPDESARFRLERVLAEIGIRPQPSAAPAVPGPSAQDLRARLVEALADLSLPATFAEGGDPPASMAEVAGATEPLLLEAVRALRAPDAVRAALGDVDQRLVATAALAEERTLTLTEGYLLSRIDGTSSAREVLQLVPLDPDETERSLLGLLLTGRVEYRPAAAPRADPQPEPAPRAFPAVEPEPSTEPETPVSPPPSAVPSRERVSRPTVRLDPETLERRREIISIFQSLPLKNHFEVLGVEPGCSDADVKRAYAGLVKRFHPDAHRDPRLQDMHDILEAIFIRVGEAWEVLGDARSRAQYEARSGAVRRPREAAPRPPAGPGPAPGPPAPASGPTAPEPAPAPAPGPGYVPPEVTLSKARALISQGRYWDAIQVLENAVPQMEPGRNQLKGRILLARAYAKNPNWVRQAEKYLHEVVREDPANVEAHYELGRLYKQTGQVARAQAAFRRVVELRPDHREAAAELGSAEGPDAPGGGLLKRLFGRGKAS
jgi:tetratricopeptide (TPR) repeat protein